MKNNDKKLKVSESNDNSSKTYSNKEIHSFDYGIKNKDDFALKQFGNFQNGFLDPSENYDILPNEEHNEGWFSNDLYLPHYDDELSDVNQSVSFEDTLHQETAIWPEINGESGQELLNGCSCWDTMDDSLKPEVECKCSGENLTHIPANLSTDIFRL